jgi:hypothetical protein
LLARRSARAGTLPKYIACVVVRAIRANQTEQAQARALGCIDCKMRRSPGSGHNRQASHGSFLHDLERDPPGHLQNPRQLERIITSKQLGAKDLVDGIVTAHIFGKTEHAAIGRKQARAVTTSRFAVRLLGVAQSCIRARKEVRRQAQRPVLNAHWKLALEFVKCACTAEPTSTADRKQAATLWLKNDSRSQRDIPNVGLGSLRRWVTTRLDGKQVLRATQQALRGKKSRDQLALESWHAQQHREGLATDPNFERLFHCDPVFG